MQVADDQPITPPASTPAASSMENDNEVGSNKAQRLQAAMEQEKSEHVKHGAGQSQLKSNDSCAAENSKSSATSELAGTTALAANLSLGAADIMDVKPVTADTAVSSHDGGRFNIAPNANKHAAAMPWLQGSKTQQSLQVFPYNTTTNSDHSVGSGQHDLQYGEKVADSQSSSSWNMLKGMNCAVSQVGKDGLMSSRQVGKSGTDAGGHELLRLLGNERELLGSQKQDAGPLRTNPSSIGTLAFLDHSLEPSSAFLRDAEQRMIQLPGLQQSASAEDQQVGHSLHLAPSNFIFGNHNRMI